VDLTPLFAGGPFFLACDRGATNSLKRGGAKSLPSGSVSRLRRPPRAFGPGPPSFIVEGFAMKTWFHSTFGDRQPRTRRSVSPTVEGLDPRRLLDGGVGSAGSAIISRLDDLSDHDRMDGPTGVVVKAPHFYEDYVGPKLAQLNAVAAAGELLPSGNLLFVGVNQGKIDPTVPQTYVWGVDRNGNLPTGPFPGRPDIRFDAVVVLTLKPGQPTTAVVNAGGKSTPLPASSFLAEGHVVAVVVPGSALPSTGLPPSQYKFNYWPEDGQRGSAHIASFAPEFNDAQVGVIRPDRDGPDTGDTEILGALTDDADRDNLDDHDGHKGKDHHRG
jgi:hypothetical protein